METEFIIETFYRYLSDERYPCVAARAAVSRQQIQCLVADHMACPKDDESILQFIYAFVDDFRKTGTLLQSAAVIFTGPEETTEGTFDSLLWNRLQALSRLDATHFTYDKRVNPDPAHPNFSFSLAEEAFFVIGLHPGSSRASRQFRFPAIVFNPHAQFEQLRESNQYEKMKNIIRRRDIVYSGSINPMLADFGESSEVYQYSGRQYDGEWICPLRPTHAESTNHSTPE
jgi:uncharacterized protein